MKASHQAFLDFATCDACRHTIEGLGKSDRRRLAAASAASILVHAALIFVLSFSAASKARSTDIVSISIEDADSPAIGGAQRASDAIRKSTSSRARPAALDAGSQGVATSESGIDSSFPEVSSVPQSGTPPGDSLPKPAATSSSRPEESDAAAMARTPGSRAPAANDETAGAAEVALGDAAGAPGDPSAELAARVGAAIEARKTYPEAARRRGAEGLVRLNLRVSGDGRLIAAKIAASSGSNLLDRAALALASSVFPLDNVVHRELEFVLAVRYSLSE